MTPEEKAQMLELCARIVEEKDPMIFQHLVDQLNQLNDLVELKERRLALKPETNGWK